MNTIIHCVQCTKSILSQRMCVPVTDYCVIVIAATPKHRGLKQNVFSLIIAWPGFLLLHLVLPGVSECLQSPRNLTGLEHPRQLTCMAASCWGGRRSSAEAVNWNTYTWSLHVDWASRLGGKVAKSSTPKKGSVAKSQMKATELLMTLPWTLHSIISSSFYWSSNSRG